MSSHTDASPKCRAVLVLEQPITGATHYRALKVALLNRYGWTDAAVKDPARFLYGSEPGSGRVVVAGNILSMDIAEALIPAGQGSTPPEARQPTSICLLGDTPALRFAHEFHAHLTLPTALRKALVIPPKLQELPGRSRRCKALSFSPVNFILMGEGALLSGVAAMLSKAKLPRLHRGESSTESGHLRRGRTPGPSLALRVTMKRPCQTVALLSGQATSFTAGLSARGMWVRYFPPKRWPTR